MVWKSHASTIYDLTFMLTKWSLYLLMDIIICVIVTLLNDNWRFGVVGGCSLRRINFNWGHGCWLLVGVERWMLLGG